jgi:hypothetical protein
VELQNREGSVIFDAGQRLKCPFMSFVEQGAEVYPAGTDIRSGQSKVIFAAGGLSAMMNRVNLPETGLFPLFARVKRPYRDAAFQAGNGFGEAFPFEPERFLVFPEIPVYGRGAYGFQLFCGFRWPRLP